MSQPVALYRKYRSRSLDELIGQEHITQTLKQALQKQSISHAYLLTGPRGVGKTSTARIIAHEINNLPYKDNATQHLDIIEIDAASNRRIEEVRDLREKIHVAPSELKYKVYIIDEVHMLTNEAFNALLKTLEEPPKHAVFILATTEVHKLPATIVSRTQRFSFRPIQAQHMVGHLRTIAKAENVSIADDALTALAEHAQGSFRDAISLLDQIAAASQSKKEVSAKDIYELVGLASQGAIESLATLILNGDDVVKVFDDIEQLHERGASMGTIAHQLAQHIRSHLPKLNAPQQHAALSLIQELLHTQSSVDPKLKLQTTLSLFISSRLQTNTTNSQSQPSPPTPPVKQRTTTRATATKPTKVTTTAPVPKPTTQNSIKPSAVMKAWSDILNELRDQYGALHAVLRQAHLTQEGEQLVLNFQYPLHMRKVQKSTNFDKLNSVINAIAGGTVEVTCVINKEVQTQSASQKIAEPVGEDTSMLEKLRGTLGGDIVRLS